MLGVYILIYLPILLFVMAFLYETFLSFRRILKPAKKESGYVDATWEVTHTFLVFGLVMLLMLYSRTIDDIAKLIFVPALFAALALGVRASCYIYMFYIRQNDLARNWVDWLFAFSHVVAAVLLVTTVGLATWYLYTVQPAANVHFVPAFLPGLGLIMAICTLPMWSLYRTK